jgi:hypothetical protein
METEKKHLPGQAIVDDFDAIRKRLRELEKEKAPAGQPAIAGASCQKCGDTKRVWDGWAGWVPCPDCAGDVQVAQPSVAPITYRDLYEKLREWDQKMRQQKYRDAAYGGCVFPDCGCPERRLCIGGAQKGTP